MAHPDDEVLWASSVLSSAAKIILCFGDSSKPRIGHARRLAMKDFPLNTLEFLDLTEARVSNRARWPNPQPSSAGLKISRRMYDLYNRAEQAYETNFSRLCSEFSVRLSGVDDVITHNPWGEYGHEEHVQVFKAVVHAQAKLGYRIWVTNYVSERSLQLMLSQADQIGQSTEPMKTDTHLSKELKQLYERCGCWTWPQRHIWPSYEMYYELAPEKRSPRWVSTLNFVGKEGKLRPADAALALKDG
ncbi:hypothetical protein [Rhodomicrobium vannielii]|nr:hypothetical protein [Rhodomicrobium vannielii]